MEIAVDQLAESAAYDLFSQVVIPRPIAWVLSDNGVDRGAQRWNLAPFSYFNTIANDPPMVMLSISDGMAGREKDSHRNLRERPGFTINLASASQAAAVQATSADLPPGRSEAHEYGVELAEWGWPTPRVAASPFAMGCIARQFTRVGRAAQFVVFAEVARLWLRADACSTDARGATRIDVAAVDPLARVGRGRYARLTEVFQP